MNSNFFKKCNLDSGPVLPHVKSMTIVSVKRGKLSYQDVIDTPLAISNEISVSSKPKPMSLLRPTAPSFKPLNSITPKPSITSPQNQPTLSFNFAKSTNEVPSNAFKPQQQPQQQTLTATESPHNEELLRTKSQVHVNAQKEAYERKLAEQNRKNQEIEMIEKNKQKEEKQKQQQLKKLEIEKLEENKRNEIMKNQLIAQSLTQSLINDTVYSYVRSLTLEHVAIDYLKFKRRRNVFYHWHNAYIESQIKKQIENERIDEFRKSVSNMSFSRSYNLKQFDLDNDEEDQQEELLDYEDEIVKPNIVLGDNEMYELLENNQNNQNRKSIWDKGNPLEAFKDVANLNVSNLNVYLHTVDDSLSSSRWLRTKFGLNDDEHFSSFSVHDVNIKIFSYDDYNVCSEETLLNKIFNN